MTNGRKIYWKILNTIVFLIFNTQIIKNPKSWCGFWGTHDVGYVVHLVVTHDLSLQLHFPWLVN